MRVLITALLIMLAAPAQAADYDDWHRDAFRVFSRLEDAREALKQADCSEDDDGICDTKVASFSERVDVMIGRVEAVAESNDLTDSEGSVVDDGHALCAEVEEFTGE